MNCVRPGRNRGGRRSNAGISRFSSAGTAVGSIAVVRSDGRNSSVCSQACSSAAPTARSGSRRRSSGAASRWRMRLSSPLNWIGPATAGIRILSFRTNVDQVVTAGPDHPIRIAHDLLTCEPTPYIEVRPGEGNWPVEARLESLRLLRIGRSGGPGVGRLPPHVGCLESRPVLSPGRDAERRGITTPAKGSDESGPSGLARPPEGEKSAPSGQSRTRKYDRRPCLSRCDRSARTLP